MYALDDIASSSTFNEYLVLVGDGVDVAARQCQVEEHLLYNSLHSDALNRAGSAGLPLRRNSPG